MLKSQSPPLCFLNRYPRRTHSRVQPAVRHFTAALVSNSNVAPRALADDYVHPTISSSRRWSRRNLYFYRWVRGGSICPFVLPRTTIAVFFSESHVAGMLSIYLTSRCVIIQQNDR